MYKYVQEYIFNFSYFLIIISNYHSYSNLTYMQREKAAIPKSLINLIILLNKSIDSKKAKVEDKGGTCAIELYVFPKSCKVGMCPRDSLV